MRTLGKVYTGTVVHKRLRPKAHALQYRVFSLLLDLEDLEHASARPRLLSYNRFNLFSFHDRDHGSGDGTSTLDHARQLLKRAGIDIEGGRVLLLAYPRVLGYVFNPLSVYYALDRNGALVGLIYEVNNTWGERHSYVVRAGRAIGGVHAQDASKRLFVSPFASEKGRYGFRVTMPEESMAVGISLRDDEGPLIKTHFTGCAEPLSDRTLAGLLFRFPLLTLKVIGAIHYEALKLWLKGVPLAGGTSKPGYSVSFVDVPKGVE